MKVLFVSQYYLPEHFQVTDICESIDERGHNVTALTWLPQFLERVTFDGR